MKNLIFFMLSVLVLSACQPENNGGGNTTNNTTATTPLNMDCINGNTYCNNNQYNKYYGFIPYPGLYTYAYNYVNYFYNNGFCNCPQGYSPVYNGSMGLGCVATGYTSNVGMAVTWNWSFGPYAGQSTGYVPAAPHSYNNYPQSSNINQQTTHHSCSRVVTQSCFVNQVNSCGSGSICRQTYSNSGLGICVRQ